MKEKKGAAMSQTQTLTNRTYSFPVSGFHERAFYTITPLPTTTTTSLGSYLTCLPSRSELMTKKDNQQVVGSIPSASTPC
jgi:hypothetical protein